MKNIDTDFIPSRTLRPPRLSYGFPFNSSFLLDYARKHHLVFTYPKGAGWDVPNGMDYGNMPKKVLDSPELMQEAEDIAFNLVRKHLEERCGVNLDYIVPYSGEYELVLEIWNNYNFVQRSEQMQASKGYDWVIAVLQDAMNLGEHSSELMWYADCEPWEARS